MQPVNRKKPVVLVLAGHDPGGGSGIQADIESIAANGCHAATVITCMTTQNTVEFGKYIPVKPANFLQQIELIRSDMHISACKIGMLGDPGILAAVNKALQGLRDIPVVFDPIVSTGTGEKIMTDEIQNALFAKLLPFITVSTPNSIEARTLTGVREVATAAEYLLKKGCKSVLITGTHEQTSKVINTLYQENDTPLECAWPRLPGSYHGSGCTLSSAIAAQLALGEDIRQAVMAAQKYTWNALKHGMQLGRKQYHPDRYYRK